MKSLEKKSTLNPEPQQTKPYTPKALRPKPKPCTLNPKPYKPETTPDSGTLKGALEGTSQEPPKSLGQNLGEVPTEALGRSRPGGWEEPATEFSHTDMFNKNKTPTDTRIINSKGTLKN